MKNTSSESVTQHLATITSGVVVEAGNFLLGGK